MPYTNYFCDKFPLNATFWSRSRYQHKRPWLKQVRPTGEEGEAKAKGDAAFCYTGSGAERTPPPMAPCFLPKNKARTKATDT